MPHVQRTETHLLGKIVQQVAVLLPHRHTQLKVLQPSERSQQLGAQLVRPLVQELQLAPGHPGRATLRGVVQLGCERRGRCTGSGVSRSVSVEKLHLSDIARIRHSGRSLGKAVSRRIDRVPRREVTPVLGDVDVAVRALGLVGDEGEGAGRARVVGVCGGRLDGSGLNTRDGRTGVAYLRLVREEGGVGSG